MAQQGLRIEVDTRNEKMGYKIREAQTLKIPYQIVIGDSEMEEGTVAVRKYGEKNTETLPIEEFIQKIVAEIRK
jgi:threonyl-tRNA synthetase